MTKNVCLRFFWSPCIKKIILKVEIRMFPTVDVYHGLLYEL